MCDIPVPEGCERWIPGTKTLHPPNDQRFLESIMEAGYLAYTDDHGGGLIGGRSRDRRVVLIYRGHRPRGGPWEISFYVENMEVLNTVTCDLEKLIPTFLQWLDGKPLYAHNECVSHEYHMRDIGGAYDIWKVRKDRQDIESWFQESRSADKRDELSRELLWDLQFWWEAGKIRLEASNERYFSLLEKRFPIGFNRIDWSSVPGHRMFDIHPTKSAIESNELQQRLVDFSSQLGSWFSDLGVTTSENVIFMGDVSEIALIMSVHVFLKCFPILFDQYQQSYVLPTDGTWCLNFNLDFELFLGVSPTES